LRSVVFPAPRKPESTVVGSDRLEDVWVEDMGVFAFVERGAVASASTSIPVTERVTHRASVTDLPRHVTPGHSVVDLDVAQSSLDHERTRGRDARSGRCRTSQTFLSLEAHRADDWSQADARRRAP
jgi:hypothetical protein